MKVYISLLLFFAFPVFSEEQLFKKIVEQVGLSESLRCHEYPEIKDLDRKFLCQDKMLFITTNLYKEWSKSDKEKVISELIKLWNKGESSNANYEVGFSTPSIRLNIVSLIGQTVRLTGQGANCLSGYRKYALEQFTDGDTFIKIDALNAIGWLGFGKDIELLTKVILSEQEGLAEKAVMSWQVLSPETFVLGASELKRNLRRAELRSFIESRILDMR